MLCLEFFQHLNSECNKVFANKDTLEDTVATTINQIAAYAMDCSQKLMKKKQNLRYNRRRYYSLSERVTIYSYVENAKI